MKLKLSKFITAGMATVILTSLPIAHADPAKPEEVMKNAPVTITFDIQGGVDKLRPSTKKCADKPCVAYIRSAAKRRGTYTLEVPMFQMSKVSSLNGNNLPPAKVMMNSDNSFFFSTWVNAQPTDIAIELATKEDGSKVLQFNRDDLNAAVQLENAEIRRKVENEPTIKKMLKQYGASLQISNIDNSLLNAESTESIGSDSDQNMIITHKAHKVVITGSLSLKTMETPEEAKARENAQ